MKPTKIGNTALIAALLFVGIFLLFENSYYLGLSTSQWTTPDFISVTSFADWNVAPPKTRENPSDFAIDCYLSLQQKKQQWIDQWLELQVPTLDTVMRSAQPGVYQVFFNPKHVKPATDLWVNATWHCNREDNHGQIVVFIREALMVECTVYNETFHSIWPTFPTSELNNSPIVYPTETPVVYPVEHYIQCDDLDQQEILQRNKKMQLGACMIARGIRPLLPQWLAYYRLLGYDHFWIYLNEPWYDKTNLTEYPDVTYIPYDFYWGDHENHTQFRANYAEIYWQESMIMHCLYRGKRLGIRWLSTTDVDEYITMDYPNVTSRKAPLKKFLKKNRRKLKKFESLWMNSVFFGRPRDDAPEDIELMIDYVHRKESNPWSRWKSLMNVRRLQYHGVHFAKERPYKKLAKIYLQHYKQPDKGIFQARKTTPIVKDTRFRDQYRDKILLAINRSRLQE